MWHFFISQDRHFNPTTLTSLLKVHFTRIHCTFNYFSNFYKSYSNLVSLCVEKTGSFYSLNLHHLCLLQLRFQTVLQTRNPNLPYHKFLCSSDLHDYPDNILYILFPNGLLWESSSFVFLIQIYLLLSPTYWAVFYM